MMSTLSSINDDLSIATIVLRMEFTTEMRTGRCSLAVELLDDNRRPTARVLVEAGGVSDLSARCLGGGITQLACLRATDVSDQQHDGVRFLLEDLEHGALSLKCDELATTRVLVNG